MEQCRSLEVQLSSPRTPPVELSVLQLQDRLKEAEQAFHAAPPFPGPVRDQALAQLLFWLYVARERHISKECGTRLQELIGAHCREQLSPEHAGIIQKPFDETLWKAGMSLSLLTDRKELQQAAVPPFRLEKIPDYFFFYSELFRQHTGTGLKDVLFRVGVFPVMPPKQELDVLRLNLLNRLFEAVKPPECVRAVPLGLPASVAFRIGICCYYGRILDCDHLRAWCFLAYAFLAGSPEAAGAYGLFFGDFNLYSESTDDADSCMELFCLHLHALLLTRAVRRQEECQGDRQGEKGSRVLALLQAPHPGGERAFEEETLFNLCCLCFQLCTCGNSVQKARAGRCAGLVAGELKELLALQDTFRLRAALVLALEFSRGDSLALLAGLLCRLCGVRTEEPDPGALQELCRQVLKSGVQEGDHDSVLVQFLSFSFDPGEESCLLAARKLSAKGCGEATFVLGAALPAHARDPDGAEAEGLRCWEKASEQGSSVAMFNRSLASLLGHDEDEACRLALAALSSGNAGAFYVLYRTCRERDREFACTCLRYAAEYLYPPALQELQELRRAEQYRPLPFMRSIEMLEKLAQHYPTACKCLATLYINSGIMPTDPFKYMEWLRRAVAMGDAALLDSLVIMYGCFLLKENNPFFLQPLKKSMQRSCRYGHNCAEPEDPHAGTATRLFRGIRKQLEQGSTLMEKQIYLNALNRGFWKNSTAINQAGDFASAHPEAGLFYFYEKYMRLLTCRYAQSLLDPEHGSVSQRVSLAQQLLRFEHEPLLAALKALLCLRALNAPPDFAAFRELVQQGSAFENQFCVLLNLMCFDSFEAYARDEDESPQGGDGIFVLRVTQ